MSWGVALRNAVGLGLGGIPSLLNAPPFAALKFNFTETNALDPRITFTRASSATYFNSAGVLSTAATDAPRFDYDPVTLAARGLLIEEQRTNLLTLSEQFDDAAWGKSSGTVTANAGVAPDGALTADLVTSTGGGVFRANIAVTNATAYTATVFVKPVEQGGQFSFGFDANPANGRAFFNLATGTLVSNGAAVTSSSITPLANGWFRCAVTATVTSTTTNLVYYNSTSGTSFLLWGAQLEAGAFATSYIPTTTTALTRAADVASVTGANFSSVFNATQGTMFVQAQQQVLFAASKSAASVNDGTSANRLTLYRQSAGGINAFANPPGAVVAGPLATAGVPWESALAYGAASPALFAVNGATQTSLTYGVNPSVFTEFTIGNAFAGGGEHFNGHIRSFAYYPKRLSAGQLQTLTK